MWTTVVTNQTSSQQPTAKQWTDKVMNEYRILEEIEVAVEKRKRERALGERRDVEDVWEDYLKHDVVTGANETKLKNLQTKFSANCGLGYNYADYMMAKQGGLVDVHSEAYAPDITQNYSRFDLQMTQERKKELEPVQTIRIKPPESKTAGEREVPSTMHTEQMSTAHRAGVANETRINEHSKEHEEDKQVHKRIDFANHEIMTQAAQIVQQYGGSSFKPEDLKGIVRVVTFGKDREATGTGGANAKEGGASGPMMQFSSQVSQVSQVPRESSDQRLTHLQAVYQPSQPKHVVQEVQPHEDGTRTPAFMNEAGSVTQRSTEQEAGKSYLRYSRPKLDSQAKAPEQGPASSQQKPLEAVQLAQLASSQSLVRSVQGSDMKSANDPFSETKTAPRINYSAAVDERIPSAPRLAPHESEAKFARVAENVPLAQPIVKTIVEPMISQSPVKDIKMEEASMRSSGTSEGTLYQLFKQPQVAHEVHDVNDVLESNIEQAVPPEPYQTNQLYSQRASSEATLNRLFATPGPSPSKPQNPPAKFEIQEIKSLRLENYSKHHSGSRAGESQSKAPQSGLQSNWQSPNKLARPLVNADLPDLPPRFSTTSNDQGIPFTIPSPELPEIKAAPRNLTPSVNLLKTQPLPFESEVAPVHLETFLAEKSVTLESAKVSPIKVEAAQSQLNIGTQKFVPSSQKVEPVPAAINLHLFDSSKSASERKETSK